MTRNYLKFILSAVFLLAVMITIFFFSSQNGEASAGTSNSVADVIISILKIEVAEGQTASTVPVVFGLSIRKLAHITLYFLLGLSGFLFVSSIFGLTKKSPNDAFLPVSLGAIALCFAYACLDEFHQSFVGGRTASFGDVGIDAIGFCTAIVICAVVRIAAARYKNNKTRGDAKES